MPTPIKLSELNPRDIPIGGCISVLREDGVRFVVTDVTPQPKPPAIQLGTPKRTTKPPTRQWSVCGEHALAEPVVYRNCRHLIAAIKRAPLILVHHRTPTGFAICNIHKMFTAHFHNDGTFLACFKRTPNGVFVRHEPGSRLRTIIDALGKQYAQSDER